MLGKVLKVVGVGALIGGTAVALYALNKKRKEAEAAALAKASGEPIEAEAVEVEAKPKVMEQVKTKIDETYKAIKERPAKLTDEQWYEKGMALFEAAEEDTDLAKAVECFKNARRMGHAPAITQLAKMTELGSGVEADAEKAFELYREASEEGDEAAWSYLAFRYAQGIGTERNPIDAFYWFTMAAAAEDDDAIAILGEIAEDITEHVDYPLEVVRDWYEAHFGEDLSEEDAAYLEAYWEGCEDDYVELDTDIFADEDVTYIITDNGDEEDIDVEIDENYTEPDEECESCEACCGCCEEPAEEGCCEAECCGDETTCCKVEAE